MSIARPQPSSDSLPPESDGGDARDRGADLRRFWAAYGISAAGSGVGAGALPLVAILVLHVADWQVSLLAVLAGLAAVALTAPLGGWIEFHPKRPTMIVADLIRGAALASVPAAAMLGILTYAQLCSVAVVQTAGTILSAAASGSYLKALAPAGRRVQVNSWLETTTWTTGALGPPVGGLLISWTSPVTSIIVDAASFLLSAYGWRRIRRPEPPPPQRSGDRHWLAETADGWRYILTHRHLAKLFWNAMLFGAAIMASTPLIAVYMLRDLQFSTAQYGLALGVPCLAGVAGSLSAPRIIRRAGLARTMLITGAARCVWMSPILLAPPTTAGLVLIIATDSGLLFVAGVFNPAFSSFRMAITADSHLSRVIGAWATTNKLAQPACIAAAGLLATAAGIRTALAALALLLLGSALLLPWTILRTSSPTGTAGSVNNGVAL